MHINAHRYIQPQPVDSINDLPYPASLHRYPFTLHNPQDSSSQSVISLLLRYSWIYGVPPTLSELDYRRTFCTNDTTSVGNSIKPDDLSLRELLKNQCPYDTRITVQKLNYTCQILPYANDISDFKVYGPFRRDINPDDLSLEARRTRTPSCKTKSDPHVQVVQAGILFCRYRYGRRTVHTLIRKGYHGGGIISVRSSDLPRVGYRPRTDPGPRRLRLPSMGSSMHGRPFIATVYVVQRPGPPFSPTIVDNTETKVASKRIAFFRFSKNARIHWRNRKYERKAGSEAVAKVLEGTMGSQCHLIFNGVTRRHENLLPLVLGRRPGGASRG